MSGLPASFIQSLRSVPGFQEEAFIAAHESCPPITSIRVNPRKPFDVGAHFPNAQPVPWCREGLYLDARPSFTIDPLFHAGCYYVQEASSMFVAEAFRQLCDPSETLTVLDLCASPGGKSTLLQSLLSPGSLLVSNELIKTRVAALQDNLVKWGAKNAVLTNNDAADFEWLPGFFDVILVDAPCSGSGLFRKDENAVRHWSPAHVEGCRTRQQKILRDVLPALKTGGTLLYSTCSYSSEENEMIADYILAEFPLATHRLDISNFPGIVETTSEVHEGFGYRFFPDKIKGEGFYLAAFKKVGVTETSGGRIPLLEKITAAEAEILKSFVTPDERLVFFKTADSIGCVPEDVEGRVRQIKQALYIRKAGVRAGSIAGRDFIPDHELAMTDLVHPEITRVEVDATTAQAYLRGEAVSLSSSGTGRAILNFEGEQLGWVKLLKGRVNNYYPKALRIVNRSL